MINRNSKIYRFTSPDKKESILIIITGNRNRQNIVRYRTQCQYPEWKQEEIFLSKKVLKGKENR